MADEPFSMDLKRDTNIPVFLKVYIEELNRGTHRPIFSVGSSKFKKVNLSSFIIALAIHCTF